MNIACVKSILVNQIEKLQLNPDTVYRNPDKDFSRNRKDKAKYYYDAVFEKNPAAVCDILSMEFSS